MGFSSFKEQSPVILVSTRNQAFFILKTKPMDSKYEYKQCSCGCRFSYPKGKSGPAGWKKVGDSVLRLSDNTLFSKGDIIQRFTEQGKQYCDMIITKIDFYMVGDNKYTTEDLFYIRASDIHSADKPTGSTNISDISSEYESADNPNTFRYIKKKL